MDVAPRFKSSLYPNILFKSWLNWGKYVKEEEIQHPFHEEWHLLPHATALACSNIATTRMLRSLLIVYEHHRFSRSLLYISVPFSKLIFIIVIFFSYRLLRQIPQQVQWFLHPARLERVGWTHHEQQILQLQHQHEREEDQAWIRLPEGNN